MELKSRRARGRKLSLARKRADDDKHSERHDCMAGGFGGGRAVSSPGHAGQAGRITEPRRCRARRVVDKADACAFHARMREEGRPAAAAEVEAARAATEVAARRIVAEAEEEARRLREETEAAIDASGATQDAEQTDVSICVAETEASWELLPAEDESAQQDGTEWAIIY